MPKTRHEFDAAKAHKLGAISHGVSGPDGWVAVTIPADGFDKLIYWERGTSWVHKDFRK